MFGKHKIAVLFVQENSIYKKYDICDCYDKNRNAMTYSGDLPVIAHPPCQLWVAFAHVNYKRWGGDHNKPGNDGGAFQFALDAVRRCGGVLEHPAKSQAWAAHGLTKPSGIGWQKCIDGGWVCEVWQSAYGHKANKATWLYCSGDPIPVRLGTPRGTHQIGGCDTRGKDYNKPTVTKYEANHTPKEFSEYLINIVLSLN